MATLSDIEGAAADMLMSMFPDRIPVRGWFGEAPAPAMPYFMYRTQVRDIPDSPITTTDGINQTVQAMATVAVDVSFNGGAAYSDALKLILSLRQSQRTSDLWKVCGMLGISNPMDLTALELGAAKARTDLTLSLSASLTLTNDAEVIDSVDLALRESPHLFDHSITISKGVAL